MLNWFKKLSQKSNLPNQSDDDEMYETFGDPKEWQPGMLALLNTSGHFAFSVVRVIPFKQIVERSEGDYQQLDENTIKSTNPFGGLTHKVGESVPCVVEKSYGEFFTTSQSYNPGSVHVVGAQNLYHTLEEIIQKELKTMFQDYALSAMNLPHIKEFIKDFPQLVGGSILDLVEYDTFLSDHNYEIQVLRDPRHEQWQYTKGPKYYWHIPGLNKRSVDYNRDKDPCAMDIINGKKYIGQSHYKSVREAYEAAEKYLDCLFAGPSE